MSRSRNDACDRQAEADRSAGVKVNFPVSSAEIDTAMINVIKDCIKDGRPIEVSDFTRALVPKEEIEPRFKRLLAAARAQGRRRK